MAVEFALRPRIRLSEGFAPPRRSRFRIPKLVLPIAAYWLAAAGITYALIHAHGQAAPPLDAQALPVAPEAKSERAWWQPSALPVATAEPTSAPPSVATVEQTTSAPTSVAPATDSTLPPAEAPSNDAPPAQADSRFALGAPREPREPRGPRRKHAASDFARAETSLDTADTARPGSRSLASARGDIPAPDLFSLSPLEPARDGDTPRLLDAPPPDAPAAVASALPSCEAAAASANQEIDLAHRDSTPDLPRESIASVLDNGVWIARCDIPMSTSLELCVAIKGGSVIGVSVSSHPANAAVNACVKRRAAGLHFPFSARVDIAKTHF